VDSIPKRWRLVRRPKWAMPRAEPLWRPSASVRFVKGFLDGDGDTSAVGNLVAVRAGPFPDGLSLLPAGWLVLRGRSPALRS
jgi:hypothetical protein